MTDPRRNIDEHAPVVGRHEIEIAAAPEVAWDVLTAIDRWPAWNPGVKSATFEQALVEGSQFRWKSGPATITSTIVDVHQPWRIAWTGRSIGLQATHVHTFVPRDGWTLVRTEESLGGPLASLLRGRLQKTVDAALEDGLHHLKAEAERRQRAV
jgi:uncharacterized protein YndB with AHSA1/START domain